MKCPKGCDPRVFSNACKASLVASRQEWTEYKHCIRDTWSRRDMAALSRIRRKVKDNLDTRRRRQVSAERDIVVAGARERLLEENKQLRAENAELRKEHEAMVACLHLKL